MTVRELIVILSKLPLEADVYVLGDGVLERLEGDPEYKQELGPYDYERFDGASGVVIDGPG